MARVFMDRRRGAIAVLSACLSVIVIGLAAFAVDLSFIAHAHTELQRTADAAALSAAAQLPDELAATSAGMATAGGNASAVSPELEASDFEFGWWDRDTAMFLTYWSPDEQPNAVRVRVDRTEAGGSPLRLFYGPLLGKKSTDVSAWAIAMNHRGLCGPLVGIHSLTASGNITTDSYSSASGAYDPAAAGNRGNLCSGGPITLHGGVHVRGDIRSGGSDDVVMRSASAIVTGNVGSRVKPLELPPVTVHDVAWNNDNVRLGKALNGARDFDLAGDHVFAIPAGIYFVNDMNLRGSARLKITGETVIILTGDLNGSGNAEFSNDTEIPSNLRILATSGKITLAGRKKFHGVIYAPHSRVDVSGNADIYGAIVGGNLRIVGNATAHFDEALQLREVELPSRTTLVE